MKSYALRFHSRGNHGMVTAAELFAKEADGTGLFASMTPHFGAAKAGEPIKVDVRLSESPIRDVFPITTPDILVVSDETLLALPETFAGIHAQTVFLVNTSEHPRVLAERFGLGNVVTIDATTIAQEEVGRSYPNIVLLGALVRLTRGGIVPMSEFPIRVVRAVFEYFGGGVCLLARHNLKAFERGHDEVRRFCALTEVGESVVPHSLPLPIWSEMDLGASLARLAETYVPVTGAWSTFQPLVDMEKCEHCLLCWPMCPDKAINVSLEGKLTEIDLRACKGCGICAAVCPPKFNAITMKEKE
jgi:2-oxoacid:acceptor oxidoreductase gamma subunit (pyruvate/2-ketoisovalerate family)/2-oxoacid:acceptor oxidoreductase delta subunit (pyruvate/2-ketoisovalerate family)